MDTPWVNGEIESKTLKKWQSEMDTHWVNGEIESKSGSQNGHPEGKERKLS